jgi:hypothetical protein
MHQDIRLRRNRYACYGVALLLLLLTLPSLQDPYRDFVPDFAADYAAAWAWWHGLDPATPTKTILAKAAPALPARTNYQTIHPPFATLLLLPFGLFSWHVALTLWVLFCWLIVSVSWVALRLPWYSCLCLLVFWKMAIYGNLEPVVFGLLAATLVFLPRRHVLAGGFLGFAIAFKVYPLILLPGLLIARRYRTILATIGSVALAMLLAEIVVGRGSTAAWIAFLPQNTLNWVDRPYNISLVRLMRDVFPSLSPMLSGLLIASVLFLPLIPALTAGSNGLRKMVPIMLLANPLVWIHYAALAVLSPMKRIEHICFAFSSILHLCYWNGLITGEYLAVALFVPVQVALLVAWFRIAKSSQVST